MTRLERHKAKLAELEQRRNKLMRSGRLVGSVALDNSIKKVKELIREAEEYEEACRPRPIKDIISKEELDEMGIIPLMIECHLIADFLTEVSYMVIDVCKEHGLDNISLVPDLTEIIRKSEKFASFLTTVSPEQCDLLVRNETFNTSLHKKFIKYIEQRLK